VTIPAIEVHQTTTTDSCADIDNDGCGSRCRTDNFNYCLNGNLGASTYEA
jgi:hypothetical protein